MSNRLKGLTIISLSIIMAGCSLIRVREDAETLRNSTVLVGVVSGPNSSGDVPVVVVAYTKTGDNRAVAHYTTLHELGPYELMVPEDTHNIIAFGDVNKNLIYDEGEPAGQILSAEQISKPAGGVSGDLDIFISEQADGSIDFPIGKKLPPKEFEGFHSTSPGAIIDIHDEIFSDEYGKKGLWSGVDFFRELGGNIYFLEEYDPTKIPILFVHGAAGSPQNWLAVVETIDRSKFQPWFYYYPSGSSMDSMSHLLFWKLQNLQTKYKFTELCITAHSMGGLVVRSFLVNYSQLFPSINNFISISTPWGGEELAELGVKYSPGVIPMWWDMQRGSDFLNSIYRKEMAPRINHYLFFGHKGNRSLLRPNNDKAVTIASQLDPRSQRDAKMIYGFDEDHMSILSSEQVLNQFNGILSDIYQRSKASGKTLGNRVIVDFSFDISSDQTRPLSALYLRPVGNDGEESWIYISPEKSGQEHGPFTPGDYEASLIAPAFAPMPKSIPVTIEEASNPRVHFKMRPTGFLRGYIAKREQPNLQAGNTISPDADIKIQSITLKGEGINRILVPLVGNGKTYDELYPHHYLSETDFTTQGAFFFFGLPDGEYELEVNAKGFKPYTRICKIKAGSYRNTLVIELN